MAERWDYVVVGAGSAGCILANKLSSDPARSVLVLEAGPSRPSKEIRIPAAFSKLFKSKYDWDFQTAPQWGLRGRSVYFPRGKALGGSSAMNAQMHIPGHPRDFDAWPASWSWETMRPHLAAFEEESCSVSRPRDLNPMTQAFLGSAREAGLAPAELTPDALEGVGPVRVHQRNGLRCTAADAWLRPARKRRNLEVRTGAQVLGVDFDGRRAARVRHTGGEAEVAGEVILCAGAIGSPHILLLSGVGPADELRAHGIEVVHEQPEVGRNLRDHVMAIGLWEASGKDSLFAAEKPRQLLKLLLGRRGMLTSNVGEAAAFLRTDAGLDVPDLELIFAPVLYLDEGLSPPDAHGFSIAAVCLQPRSVGTLSLASGDPLEQPLIDPRFLSDPADVRVLAHGIERARAIVAAGPLAALARSERAPGERELEDWIRSAAHTIYHPVGTCALGTVLDSQLRVEGLEGIRVADAAAIPALMRGHSHAQVSMLALRAAELIGAGA